MDGERFHQTGERLLLGGALGADVVLHRRGDPLADLVQIRLDLELHGPSLHQWRWGMRDAPPMPPYLRVEGRTPMPPCLRFERAGARSRPADRRQDRGQSDPLRVGGGPARSGPAAVSAMAWSLSAGTAPLTPTAPAMRPSIATGTAPRPNTNAE